MNDNFVEYDYPKGKFILGDCLKEMQSISDNSVDMILCDLPYGTTYAKWDSVIPLDKIWNHYKRIIKKNAVIALTAVQPFASALIVSNPSWFKYEWIWDKVSPANFANANRQPMKVHENIIIFYQGQSIYNPIKIQGKPNHMQGNRGKDRTAQTMNADPSKAKDDISGLKFPKSIQTFPKHSSQCGLHPTQKPVELFEYLIKTYTDKGDIILDNCAGSGTTAIAAINTRRNWICIEREQEYFNIAVDRIDNHIESFNNG